jgi:hypothetical protein
MVHIAFNMGSGLIQFAANWRIVYKLNPKAPKPKTPMMRIGFPANTPWLQDN